MEWLNFIFFMLFTGSLMIKIERLYPFGTRADTLNGLPLPMAIFKT